MYYLADVLTLTEGILSLIIMCLSFAKTPPETILFIFVAAEICDALDGPCARHWHYPNDGRYRWWREYCEWTDKATDLLAGASLVFYITVHLNRSFGTFICLACLFIGLSVQLFIYDCKGIGYNFKARQPIMALRIVCIRRFFYAATIFIVINYLIMTTSWTITTKYSLGMFSILVGLILTLAKGNRLREW